MPHQPTPHQPTPHQPVPHQPKPTSRRGRQSPQPPRRPKVAGLQFRPDSSSEAGPPGHLVVEQPNGAIAKNVAERADAGDAYVRPVDAGWERADQANGWAARADGARVEETDTDSDAVTRQRTGLIGGYAVPVALVLLAAVLAGLAVWFRGEADHLRSGGAAQNRALVDSAATSEVAGQITTAVQTVFSYDFADTAKTENAAKDLLAGQAIAEYQQLFSQVREQAPQQKLVLTTTVKSVGVKVLDGNNAVLLVFADQNAVRTDTGDSNVGPAQLTVNAQRTNGRWRITEIIPR